MDRSPHILEDFELELQSLRGAVLSMAQTALEMVSMMGRIFDDEKPDPDESQMQERELDHSEVRVDEQARLILMRYQPVASDFREVTGALRISSDLENIGDEAHRIAARYEYLRPWISHDSEAHLSRLWTRCDETLRRAIQAYSDHDVPSAKVVIEQKHLLVEEAEGILRNVSKAIASSNDLAPRFLDAVSAATGLERIGRIATNIADTVVFIETAKDTRHNINPS